MKKPKRQPYPKVPPYAFWISSRGEIGWGATHLAVLRDKPKMFGLLAAPTSNVAYDTVYAFGWAKVNVINGRAMYATMEHPLKALFDELAALAQKWQQIDEVYVEFMDGTIHWGPHPISELIDEKFPAQWRMNPRKGRR